MKKGFTLIELLAVIVILAIIAVIAVPITIKIIEESKASSTLISAEFYLDAVELSLAQTPLKEQTILDGTYNILESGNICLEYDNNKCTNELVVEVKGEVPESGTITITDENITGLNIILNEKEIVQNSKGELVYYKPTLELLCELIEGTANTIGAKYSCDFGDGARNFYILELGSNPVTGSTLKSDELALILEGNYDTKVYPWPVAQGQKLDEIASVWTKLEREQIGLPSAYQVVTADGQNFSGSGLMISETNPWLYNWPDNPNYGNPTPKGYWTSTPAEDSNVFCVRFSRDVYKVFSGDSKNFNVRPVVNLKI